MPKPDIEQIYAGDTSDIWNMFVKDADGELLPLDANWRCFVELPGSTEDREVTEKVDANNEITSTPAEQVRFRVYLSREETAGMEKGTQAVIVKFENDSFDPPMRARTIRTVKILDGGRADPTP